MFPPPLHGMSLINEYVKKNITESTSPLIIDFSPRNLDRSFAVRFGKIFRIISCVFQLLLYLVRERVDSVYLGLSGGNGQFYDAIFAGICRAFGKNLYLHHHSYQYLNHFRWLAKILFVIAGKDAIHIVACDKMSWDLKRLYPVVDNVRIISGIVALEFWSKEVRQRERVESIGFLSNISIEKGILEFLDIAAWADYQKLPLRFLIAGPYHDSEVRSLVENRIAVMSNVTCVGGVYGAVKREFFDSIDVFLFPSKNESEGLVIHEAMSRGVPVIAYSRGCIEQIISDKVGLKFSPEEDYVARSMDKIQEWLFSPQSFQVVAQSALSQFSLSRLHHLKEMDNLCNELVRGKS
jgi:glycosyltransferase involved in cell wall biosynthesis